MLQTQTNTLAANTFLQTAEIVNLKKAGLVFHAINHKLRQQILILLHGSPTKQMTVTDIYVQLRLEQSVASQHLAVLRRAGFVKTDRDGKFILYQVNYENYGQVIEKAAEFLEISK